jgi:hypothetical protein
VVLLLLLDLQTSSFLLSVNFIWQGNTYTRRQSAAAAAKNSDSNKKRKKKSYYYYEYFVVRHYDPDLYEEQKYYLDIRSDGRIEHRIEEKDIPPDIVQKLRSRSKLN